MTTLSSPTIRRSELDRSLSLVEIKPGIKFSQTNLQSMLTDIETALFFGKVYNLDAAQLGKLLALLFKTPLVEALLTEGGQHSDELQDYLVDLCDVAGVDPGELTYGKDTSLQGELLPEMWKMLEVEIAQSIKDVAAKLESVVGVLPGKQGQMVFQSMLKLNKQRPTLGVHQAKIHHAPQRENLVILDVSGSMTANTIRTIVDDVVALSYQANAHLAIVSNTCTHWMPGSFNSDDVLAAAEFQGTRYEELSELLDQDWGVVITIADYDSSMSAYHHIKDNCRGHVELVLDISLVGQPTFLAKCVGQLASEVKPLLIGNSDYVLRA